MNFAQMLFQNVKPLYTEEEQPRKRSGNPHPDHTKGNAARTRKSIERMQSVLPKGKWVAGSTIASRLGTTPASSNSTLFSLAARGLVESRRINPRYRNLEWRWT